MFEVGDVVVCVDVAPRPWHVAANVAALRTLKLRGLYTIRSAVLHSGYGWAVTLAELSEGSSPGWAADRFRKLPKADASFTEQMRALRPHKAPATANESLSLMILDLVEAM